MSNVANFTKWFVLGAIAVLLFLVFKQCNKPKPVPAPVATLTHDTVRLNGKDSIVYVPQPYAVIKWKPVVTKPGDTLPLLDSMQCCAEALDAIMELGTTRFYDTTIGGAQIKDTVNQNRITGRSVVVSRETTVVTNTVTVQAQRRNVLLFGITAIGNKDYLPYGSGVSLDLLLKTDAVVGVSAFATQNKALYGFSIKFPIRLRKTK